VPVQKRRTPSSVKMRYAQWNELRYCARASSDCMRVLITLTTNIDTVRLSPLCCYDRTDALKRHRGVHGHETRNCAHAEGDAAGQGLPRSRAALHELLERRVCREANGRISTLPHHLRLRSVNMRARRPESRNRTTGRTTGKSPR
jgi:hypothetical protein